MGSVARSFCLGGRLMTRSHTHGHMILSGVRASLMRQHRDPQGPRTFSSAEALDVTLAATQQIYTGLHTFTGLPWFFTIPLVALSVNIVTRLPTIIYVQRLINRRKKLTPLMQSWYALHAAHHARERLSEEAHKEKVKKSLEKSNKELFARWGVQEWKNYTGLVILPIWLAMMEGLRRLCGYEGGLLTMLFKGSKERSGLDALQPLHAELTADEATSSSASVSAVTERLASTESLADVTTSALLSADASLTTEGCLWFTDLTVPDPMYILPFVLSAVMFANMAPNTWNRWQAIAGVAITPGTSTDLFAGKGVRLQRALMLLTLVVGPATINVPAALQIYWITSATSTWFSSKIIKKVMHEEVPTITPCTGRERWFIWPRPDETEKKL